MTFVSKYGRRTPTEDLYREVLQRWQKCLTIVLLVYLCAALVLTMSAEDDQADSPTARETSRRHNFESQFQKVSNTRQLAVNLSYLLNSVQQVSATAKDCQQQTSLNATVTQEVSNNTVRDTTLTKRLKANTTSGGRQPACSSKLLLLPLSEYRNYYQCLYLDELSAEEACGPIMRNQVHLRFCAQYNLGHLLPEGNVCQPSFLAQVRQLDEAAKLLACQFENLLQLYDCDTSYSVSWSCSKCRLVYKHWVCAMVLPFHLDGQLLKPCRSVCRLVEQMCPYFHPSVKEQYAGERVFKCIDPDIPDLESISLHSVFGPKGRCYCPHHLDATTETLNSAEDEECQFSIQTLLHREKMRTITTTSTPATNFSNETSGNSSKVTVATMDTNSTFHSGSPVLGTSSACVFLLFLVVLLTLQSRTFRFLSSGREPT